MMVGDAPEELRDAAGRPLAVSGYAVAVDWSANAVLEFLYFDLVVGQRKSPADAVRIVRSKIAFAGEGEGGLDGLRFRLVE